MIKVIDIINLVLPIKVIGDTNGLISKAQQLDELNSFSDVIMWVSEKNLYKIDKIKSGIILCPICDYEKLSNAKCTYIICTNPRLAFQKILATFFIKPRVFGISKTSYIDESVKLGKNIYIGHNVVIEQDCKIGDNVTIDHNTIIKHDTIIGNNVIIGSNNVIGGVGFGYEKDESGTYLFIPHIGNVVIMNNVEIGNNTCIDRAVLGSTFIDCDAKIDNLVHIAHGVKIGKNSLIIANAMVAGSVNIGENVWVAPSSSILNGLVIENDSLIGLGAVIVKNVKANSIVIGNPGKVLEKK